MSDSRKTTTALVAVLGCAGATAMLREAGGRPNAGLAFLTPSAAGAGRAPPSVDGLAAGSERLRATSTGAGAAATGSVMAPLAGLLAAGAVAGAVRGANSKIRSRVEKPPYGISRVVGTGEIKELTREESEAYLKERRENLSKFLPMTAQEFEDEVDELEALSMHPFLQRKPKSILGRVPLEDKAKYKTNYIMRNRETFETLRLFKPIALKYPDPLRTLTCSGEVGPQGEDRSICLNATFFAQTEKIAGFTYEDWAAETNGMKFDNWTTVKLGDLVEGEVVSLNERGAFVEIGDKSWAFIPLNKCSLAPIAHPEEVLSIGDQITGEVIDLNAESTIEGESVAQQKVLSLTGLQNEVAWDEIDAVIRVDEGTSNIFKVLVKQMRPWGAIVMTERGLEGYIPNQHLADKVGDSTLVGTQIEVELLRADRSRSDARASRPADFALTFSYANFATKQLAQSLEEGQVVSAVVKEVTALNISVEVMNVRCSIRKIDISGSLKSYEVGDIFEVGEEIKVYVISVLAKNGAIRLSTRALEFKKGALLTSKAEVFERAEETAKKYLEQASEVKGKFEKTLADLGDTLAPKKKKAGGIDIETGLGDGLGEDF